MKKASFIVNAIAILFIVCGVSGIIYGANEASKIDSFLIMLASYLSLAYGAITLAFKFSIQGIGKK